MKTVIQTSNDVGNFLKAAREKAGMTQDQVSKRSGFTNQTIYNMENNKGSLNLSTVLAIATSIGVKIELNYEKGLSA